MRTIYAIRDRVANDLVGQFPLVVFRTDAQAVRFFGDSMAVERSAIHAHPSDYELIKIGELDDDGQLGGTGQPQIIITGDALIAATTPNTEPQLVKDA